MSCNTARTLENTYKHGVYDHSRCKVCHNKASREWTKANPHARALIARRNKLLKKYGVTLTAYETILQAQQGCCKLCRSTQDRRPLNVDHCHTTGRIRGLLCDKCNLAIGLLGDRLDVVHRIVGYLDESAVS